jgi:hypothetical protein
MNIRRNIKLLRKTCFVLDIANFVLGIVIIVLGIMILINVHAFIKLFPILFLFAFFMNLSLSFKHYLNNNKAKYITMLTISSLLLIITLVGFVATWG